LKGSERIISKNQQNYAIGNSEVKRTGFYFKLAISQQKELGYIAGKLLVLFQNFKTFKVTSKLTE
jgi:hypothetical protein